MKLNENYSRLAENYLFREIAQRVKSYNGNLPIIRMGIGDVTLPLPQAVTAAMEAAAREMSVKETFRGYGPEQGYDFLREKIASYYAEKSVTLDVSEIFVSDGAKSDIANFLDLFDRENTVAISSPVYPVYVDTNVMAGRKVKFILANSENGYLPLPEGKLKADIVYICSPNNPTGAVYDRTQLKEWVDFACKNGALILFDAAYEAFIGDDKYPSSIYEIEGARSCAVEFCSLSKTAGFTGTRCGYTVVPKELAEGKLNSMWLRRQTTKFNGVSYIVQRGAEAVFTPEGRAQIKANIDYYKGNAAVISKAFKENGVWFVGGVNSPYVWFKIPDGLDSWKYFDYLLQEKGVVGTPGAGFGEGGEGYFRFSSFGSRQATEEAMRRIIK